MVVYTFNAITQEAKVGRSLWVLVYRASSKTAKAMQRNPVSERKKKKERKHLKVLKEQHYNWKEKKERKEKKDRLQSWQNCNPVSKILLISRQDLENLLTYQWTQKGKTWNMH